MINNWKGLNFQNQVSSEIPDWVKFPETLDLERLADDFISKINSLDLSSTVMFLPNALDDVLNYWNNIRVFFVHDELHDALIRLVNLKLNSSIRGILSRSIAGCTLLHICDAEAKQKPDMPSESFFSTPKIPFYGYCVSIFTKYGSNAAKDSLKKGKTVVLALRKESNSLANKGRGSYDDKIIVLKDKSAYVFPACTEPGAQYSHRAKKMKDGKVRDEAYCDVSYRKPDGIDINEDGILDAGRLVEETYHYFEKPDGHLNARAFETKKTQVVERDVYGDGLFREQCTDLIGAGTTMFIHKGSKSNTDSSGCQTIPDDKYSLFLGLMPKNSDFYYVLVNMD